MATRYFTADFHLGSAILLDKERVGNKCRPFKTLDRMHEAILRECMQRTTYADTIIHVGDLGCYKKDREYKGLDVKPIELLKGVEANLVLVEGNHDANNQVRCAAKAMLMQVGVYLVSVGHFPSTDSRCMLLSPVKYDGIRIHICGHVHKFWRLHFDEKKKVLNINVGLDAWNYHIVPEKKLISVIDSTMYSLGKEQATSAWSKDDDLNNAAW